MTWDDVKRGARPELVEAFARVDARGRGIGSALEPLLLRLPRLALRLRRRTAKEPTGVLVREWLRDSLEQDDLAVIGATVAELACALELATPGDVALVTAWLRDVAAEYQSKHELAASQE